MRYQRLKIINYRGVSSSEIRFQPDGVTLIQGRNEVGKTSLGEAIGLLFEYPASSRNKAIIAVRPVNRDVGSEIELEAESGAYKFTYSKRFHKKPQTTLQITAPRAENHTGREAHERAQQILSETLDIDLWKALTIHQGEAVDQPNLSKQQSLSAALDKAAGGVPTDEAEEGLFEKVTEEYERYYTPTGQEKKALSESRARSETAQASVDTLQAKLRELDDDTETAARLQKELADLKQREVTLGKQLTEQRGLLSQIEKLENQVAEARLNLRLAENSFESANKNRVDRDELIQSVTLASKQHQELAKASQGWISRLADAEKDLQASKVAYQEADRKRKEADAVVNLRRADYDYYNNKLFMEQLSERKLRIDQARQEAARAEEILSKNRVDEKLLKKIEAAERLHLAANARLETAAPNVKLTGLGDCKLKIDDEETTIEDGQTREFSVSEKLQLVLPNQLKVQVAAGSSIDQLMREVADTQEAIDAACRKAGVETPEAARNAFDSRKEAAKAIEEKVRVEEENLRDLTYDGLAEKLVRLDHTVPEYLTERTSDLELAKDLSEAKNEWHSCQAAQQACQESWEVARKAEEAAQHLRDSIKSENESASVELRSLEADLKRQEERLSSAREAVADESLQQALALAQQTVESEKQEVNAAEESLKAKNPGQVKALVETDERSLETCKQRRQAAGTELTEVQTRLKIHGEEGLYEKLQDARTQLERVASKNHSLFRRAAAAKLLYEIMQQERDDARRAYVAPLKSRIEQLGRLVFDETFQVELDENLQIVSRTHDGVTVPFESLSGGTKEQLSLVFRLACSMIVADEGGMPLMMDDALGYTDPDRLRLMGAILARAAKDCQIVIFTCVPERYANIGSASVVSL